VLKLEQDIWNLR